MLPQRLGPGPYCSVWSILCFFHFSFFKNPLKNFVFLIFCIFLIIHTFSAVLDPKLFTFASWMIRSRRFHLCQGTNLKIAISIDFRFTSLYQFIGSLSHDLQGKKTSHYLQDFQPSTVCLPKYIIKRNNCVVTALGSLSEIKGFIGCLARPLGNTATIMEDGRLNRRLKKTKEIMHLKNSYEFNMNDEKNSRSFCIIFCIFAQVNTYPFN